MSGAPGVALSPDSSEEANRTDWWLSEYGCFPPVQQLRIIRAYRRYLKRNSPK